MAKKIVKPDLIEEIRIQKRLRDKYPPEKYPHMYEKKKKKPKESWVDKLKRKVRAEIKSQTRSGYESPATKRVSRRLKDSGLTDKEINRLKGKK